MNSTIISIKNNNALILYNDENGKVYQKFGSESKNDDYYLGYIDQSTNGNLGLDKNIRKRLQLIFEQSRINELAKLNNFKISYHILKIHSVVSLKMSSVKKVFLEFTYDNNTKYNLDSNILKYQIKDNRYIEVFERSLYDPEILKKLEDFLIKVDKPIFVIIAYDLNSKKHYIETIHVL